jgi:hypothetical protein
VAQRLSDHRAERGLKEEEANGSSPDEEKSLNVVSVIQVPLKHRPIARRSLKKKMSRSRDRSRKCDVEEAVIKVGKVQGPFKEIEGIAIERDPNYPVRVTLQFYKCTSAAVLDDEVLKTISQQLETARTNADAVGSLVLPFATKRPTEWQHQTKSTTEGTDKEHNAEFLDIPAWWGNWWLVNGIQFPNLEERDAKRLLFKEGKHSAQTLSEAHNQILRELSSHTTRAGPEFKKDSKYVKWGKATLG